MEVLEVRFRRLDFVSRNVDLWESFQYVVIWLVLCFRGFFLSRGGGWVEGRSEEVRIVDRGEESFRVVFRGAFI